MHLVKTVSQRIHTTSGWWNEHNFPQFGEIGLQAAKKTNGNGEVVLHVHYLMGVDTMESLEYLCLQIFTVLDQDMLCSCLFSMYSIRKVVFSEIGMFKAVTGHWPIL